MTADNLPKLPPRDAAAHKGTFGTALIVGGSRGMSGAVAMTGMAALRGGAGLVRLAVPENCLETVAGFNPCYMTTPLPADGNGRIAADAYELIVEMSESATALALGPGLGRSKELDELVQLLYGRIERPMVVDADALNALADSPQDLLSPGGPRILTPHPGEFARLFGSMPRTDEERTAAAARLARRTGAVVVLKGHRTCISDAGKGANPHLCEPHLCKAPEGPSRQMGAQQMGTVPFSRTHINTTGNPGMAGGGSGDVLTGLVTALCCQGLSCFDAARLAAHLHGLAGDLAAEKLGQIAMIATDIIDALPTAMKSWEGEAPAQT